ncbi:MAG: hypothetical protein VB140_03550 [Burkholderia sp.]
MAHKNFKVSGHCCILVRNPFISLEIMPVNAIASSRLIYATTSG